MKIPKLKRFGLGLIIVFWGLSGSSVAIAQMPFLPPHLPGTICATRFGWCWLPQQLYLNTPCVCPGPYNQMVPGVAV